MKDLLVRCLKGEVTDASSLRAELENMSIDLPSSSSIGITELSTSSSISNEIDKSIKEDFSVSQAAIDEIKLRKERGEKPESLSNEEIKKNDPILDTYKVLDDAIHGGMGSVWRVHHESWNTDLAMKRPQPRFFAEGSEARKEEFIRECENWINLGLHPNIVSCYYVREIGGVPTIFSEWMDNGSLKDRIKDGSLYEGTEEEVQERILDIAIQIERGTSGRELMRRAAQGVFDAYEEWDGKSVAVFCGSGNNGGDGYALAQILHDHGIKVTVFRISDKFSEDGAYYYNRCIEKDISVSTPEEGWIDYFAYDIYVDCLLGTGFRGTPREPIATIIREINENRRRYDQRFVISVDINSGMNGNTGEAELAVESNLTVSIGSVILIKSERPVQLRTPDINIRQEGLCHPDVDMSNLLVSYGEIAPVIQLFAVFGSLLDEN